MSRCGVICKTGKKCKYLGKHNGKCGIHYSTIDDCPVCFENTRLRKLSCGHLLCTICSKKWFKDATTCPCCRAVVRRKKVVHMNVSELLINYFAINGLFPHEVEMYLFEPGMIQGIDDMSSAARLRILRLFCEMYNTDGSYSQVIQRISQRIDLAA